MNRKRLNLTRSVYFLTVFLLLLSMIFAVEIPRAGTLNQVDNKIIVEGAVTGLTGKYIEIDGKKYDIGEDYVIVDEHENTLPVASLRNSQKVGLEVSHGYVQKIYVLILPQ